MLKLAGLTEGKGLDRISDDRIPEAAAQEKATGNTGAHRESHGKSSFGGSGVFAEHAEDFALDADVGGGGVDRGHLGV